MLSNNEFVVVGDNGLIMQYFNNKWEKISTQIKNHLYAVDMIDRNSGWCVGSEGSILRFTDQDSGDFSQNAWQGFESIMIRGYAKMIADEYGVVVADFNNDDLPDVFTCGLFEGEHLYINYGNFSFLDQAKNWGLNKQDPIPEKHFNLGACAGDIDNDGFVDLYVSTLNGHNKLYKNIKGRRFEDMSKISGCIGSQDDRTNSCIMGDVDNDGDLDIFILNEYSSNRLFLNNGAGVYSEITKSAGLKSIGGGMAGTFGDIDGDGDIDLFVSNWSIPNALYLNKLKESGILEFENIAEKSGVLGESFTKSNGVVLTDIDVDGDLDIFVANRKSSNHLYINDGKGLFTDEAAARLGLDTFKTNGVLIADMDGDAYKDIYLSNVGENIFYKGQKNGSFKIETALYGAELGGYSTGLGFGDFDNDRDYDFYVANYIDESSMWFRNKLNEQRFLPLQIEGYLNNRSAIGTKIFTYSGGHLDDKEFLIDFSHISAGQGYASMNQFLQLIPVKNDSLVDIRIVFPSGINITRKAVKTNTSLLIQDVEARDIPRLKLKKHLIRTFGNPYELFEFIKKGFFIVLLGFFLLFVRKRFRWRWNYIVLFGLLITTVFFTQIILLEYRPLLFSTILPLGIILGLMALTYLYFERIRLKKIAAYEQKEIRNKLARDLHDDLAATISTTGIYLSLIQNRVKNSDNKLQNLFDQANTMIENAGTRVADLVWAIKAKEENLDQFFSRIQKNFGEIFYEKGIRFIIRLDENDELVVLSPEIKQNIYLIIKESLNNMIKYAQAEKIEFIVKRLKNRLSIIIKDDGIGFQPDHVENKGHGLENLKKRASEINADFTLWSEPGKGSSVTLTFSIKI